MAEKRKKLERFTTPEGRIKFAWLTKPDMKYPKNGGGVFKATLILPEAEAQPLIEQLDAALEKAVEEAKVLVTENPKLAASLKKQNKMDSKGRLTVVQPYSEELDEDGKATGNYEFTFKMNELGKPKEDGTQKRNAPAIFDAAGKPLKKGVAVYGGSLVAINFSLLPFCAPVSGTGVSLRLNAVQVIELMTSGGGSAESFGFKKREGYTADESEGDDEESQTSGGEAGGDEEEDF